MMGTREIQVEDFLINRFGGLIENLEPYRRMTKSHWAMT